MINPDSDLRTPAAKPDTAWDRPAWVAPILLVAAAALSYYWAGFGLPSSDEGALLTNAARLLRGGVFYRDIDSYPFPLAPYLLAGAFAVFGEHLSVSRAVAGFFFCGITLSLYLTALHLIDRRRAALFAAMLLSFKFLAYPGFTVYSYWDISFCFGCIAIWLLVAHPFRGPTLRFALAGVAIGLALVAKQNLGIYLGGISGLLILFAGPLLGAQRARRSEMVSELVVLAATSLSAFAVMAVYFASHGLFATMLESGLVAPFTGYIGTSSIPFSVPLEWWNLGDLTGHPGLQYQPIPIWQLLDRERLPGAGWYDAYWITAEVFLRSLYTSIPLAFIGVLVLCLRSGDRPAHRQLTIVAALAFGLLCSAFPRADYGHIISIYPVVALLLFALLARARRWNISIWRAQLAAVAALLVSCTSLTALNHSYLTRRIELERARVWVHPDSWLPSVVDYVTAELDEGDALFVFGQEAELYFLTGHFFPWRFAQLYPGQAGGDEGRSLLGLLQKAQPPLIIRGMMAWPGLPSLPDYVPQLDDHISENFRVEADLFERYPLPPGTEAPPWWALLLLRPCPAPVEDCYHLKEYRLQQAPLPLDPREIEERLKQAKLEMQEAMMREAMMREAVKLEWKLQREEREKVRRQRAQQRRAPTAD